MTVRILGVDPGLRTTGYGVIDVTAGRPHLVEAGLVCPNAKDSLERRLNDLHEGMTAVVIATRPSAMVIEELYTTYRNPSTAIMMGHARGVLCLTGAQHGVPVHTLAHSMVSPGSGVDRLERAVRI
ncbi:MAG: crossover junction endodeoxyribonuclease RuvC, partial [Candidatus Baltobacteraceae bacterium]